MLQNLKLKNLNHQRLLIQMELKRILTTPKKYISENIDNNKWWQKVAILVAL